MSHLSDLLFLAFDNLMLENPARLNVTALRTYTFLTFQCLSQKVMCTVQIDMDPILKQKHGFDRPHSRYFAFQRYFEVNRNWCIVVLFFSLAFTFERR